MPLENASNLVCQTAWVWGIGVHPQKVITPHWFICLLRSLTL